MENKAYADLERDIARLGERAHAASQLLHAELTAIRAALRSGVRGLARSPALPAIAFAMAASAGAWAALRSQRPRRHP